MAISPTNLSTKRIIENEESSPNKKIKLNDSPEKWYPLKADAGGRIRVELTPTAKSAQKVIYMFKNFETGRVLIGMTGQRLSKRVSQYLTKINKTGPQGEFYVDTKENYAHIRFGILHRLQKDEKLTEVEKAYLMFEKFLNQYNKKIGGGCAVVEPPEQPLPTLTPEQLEALKENIPEKSYALMEVKPGILRFQLSPNGAAKRGLVYGICDGEGHWLVGKTEQSLLERIYSYHTLINKKSNEHPLAQQASANPTQIKLHVLKEELWGAELSFMEKTFIHILDCVKNGYNRNGGGGGGGALRRRLFT